MGKRTNVEFEEWFTDPNNVITPLELWEAATKAAKVNRDEELRKHNEGLRKQLQRDRMTIFNLKKTYQELELKYYELEERTCQRAA
jgi:hypothetical protein